jgi:hypothetical protein
MNKIELITLAIQKLNTKEIKTLKKQLSQRFNDKRQKKECMNEFDKNFIKSFVLSYKTQA